MQIGDHVGPYRLDAVLGRGGMGVVYRAYDERHDWNVALKLIAPDLVEGDEYRRRFDHESRIAAKLANPHVIPIHAFGTEAGQPCAPLQKVPRRLPSSRSRHPSGPWKTVACRRETWR